MNELELGLLNFWQTLNKNNVRYIMAGGFATRFHGYNVSSQYIDVWLDDSIANRRNLRKSFIDLGYGDYEPLETIQFVPGWTNLDMGNCIDLNIMTEMKGVDLPFSECLQLSPKADIDGLLVPFLHINHLIDNKKAINRGKDQIAASYLEKIREIRRNHSK